MSEQFRITLSDDTARAVRRFATAEGIEMPAALKVLIARGIDAGTLDALLFRASTALAKQETDLEYLAIEILSRVICLQAKNGAVDHEQEAAGRKAIVDFLAKRRAALVGGEG